MIVVALGSNLPSSRSASSETTLRMATELLGQCGFSIRARSRIYASPPWPPSGQPWFRNAVVAAESLLPAGEAMARLHRVEAFFGRRRSVPNAARPLDLDLIDLDGRVTADRGSPILPHPRMCERAFVLLPLRDVLPDWRHPARGEALADLIAALPADHGCRPCGTL